MTPEPQPTSFGFPSDEQIQIAFESYALAVGKIAHAWNYLHEKLGLVFVYVVDADRAISLAIWNSTDSDRAKHGMFKAAVEASKEGRWAHLP